MFRATVHVRPNPGALRALMHGRTGPVTRFTEGLGRRMVPEARKRVGVKSGRLRDSIAERVVPDAAGAFKSQVSGDTPYAAAHHDRNHYLADAARAVGL